MKLQRYGRFVALVGLGMLVHSLPAFSQPRSDCAQFFEQYGLQPVDRAAAEEIGFKRDLIEERLFPGEACSAAALALDVTAATQAVPIEEGADITGVYLNENSYFSFSGAVLPAYEILDIEHYGTNLIISQFAIGTTSVLSDNEGNAVYPIRISRVRFVLGDAGTLQRDERSGQNRFYADLVSWMRYDDLLWKLSVNYWDFPSTLRQAPNGKLVLAFQPQGAQAEIFQDDAYGLATFRPVSWADLTSTRRLLRAGSTRLDVFPCLLRKVEQGFADESLPWISVLDALSQEEAWVEARLEIAEELSEAQRLGQDTSDISAREAALVESYSTFKQSANGQLFDAMIAQDFGCMVLP